LAEISKFVVLNFLEMDSSWANYVGYAASVFVVLSFMLKNIKQIRIVNLVGCVAFVIYGVFSGMLWPIIIPNAILCFIQAYHLIKKD
jgi:fucose permease